MAASVTGVVTAFGGKSGSQSFEPATRIDRSILIAPSETDARTNRIRQELATKARKLVTDRIQARLASVTDTDKLQHIEQVISTLDL